MHTIIFLVISGYASGQTYFEVGDSVSFRIKENIDGLLMIEPIDFARNTFFGESAGLNNASTTGSNVFVGFHAGTENTIGERNAYIGWRAGAANETGASNTFVGSSAGASNTGSGNTLIGYAAGEFQLTGNSNVFIGTLAGTSRTVSNENIIIGYQAGGNGDGDRNIFIGTLAGSNEPGSNKLYIDQNNTSSSPLIYGDFSSDELAVNGELGINVNTPEADIHILQSETASTGGTGGIIFESSQQNATKWQVHHSGANLSFTLDGNRRSYITPAGAYVDDESFDLPPQERSLAEASSILKAISTYTTQSDAANGSININGQSLIEHFPEAVAFDEEGTPFGVIYQKLTILTLKTIQEQQDIIEELKRNQELILSKLNDE